MTADALPLRRLTERREFVRAARDGAKRAMPGVVLQAYRRRGPEAGDMDIGVGFTASRKVGGAVVRNRARRRLKKEAARLVLPHCAQPGHDYVLVARKETPARPFADLLADLRTALDRMKLCRQTRDTHA